MEVLNLKLRIAVAYESIFVMVVRFKKKTTTYKHHTQIKTYASTTKNGYFSFVKGNAFWLIPSVRQT